MKTTLNTIGLACPMPVIKIKKQLFELKQQSSSPEASIVLEVLFSDKGGLRDIPAFCQQAKMVCSAPEETVFEGKPCFKVILSSGETL